MLFNSLDFVVFFPVVVAIYFAVPHRFRWALLLAASYYFYMCWRVEYVVLIMASTLVDYVAALGMGRTTVRSVRRACLLLSLGANLGLLFTFKYFNFFSDSFRAALDQFSLASHVPHLEVLLPVGISFYTFQTLSYTIDVYRGHRKPEKHLGVFALYVAFFPQLVAGPIERSTRLIPQFFEKHDFDYARFKEGLGLMLWGFFKKLVVADRLALYVDTVYADPQSHAGTPLIVATYFFAWQIFCDFSGYSDIAIGSAKILGYDLMQNFDRPYFARNIREFWHRWHISLSTWFRDYVYIPLGGSRTSRRRWYTNLIVVFVLSGIWHGANWTFMAWGAVHGIFLVVSLATGQARTKIAEKLRLAALPRIHAGIQIFVTFHLVVFAWVLFRANSLADAAYIFVHFADGGGTGRIFTSGQIAVGLASIAFLTGVHILQRGRTFSRFMADASLPTRWALYYAMIFGILVFGVFTKQQFIYFRF